MKKCIHCGSESVVKQGFFRGRQKFTCKDCGKYFCENSKPQFKGKQVIYKGKDIARYISQPWLKELFSYYFENLLALRYAEASIRVQTCHINNFSRYIRERRNLHKASLDKQINAFLESNIEKSSNSRNRKSTLLSFYRVIGSKKM